MLDTEVTASTLDPPINFGIQLAPLRYNHIEFPNILVGWLGKDTCFLRTQSDRVGRSLYPE